MDEKTYKRYKRRIDKTVAVVDNKPPKFEVNCYYKKRNLTIDADRIREIDKENMEMLKRMSVITRTRGVVDCWMPRIKYTSDLEDQDTVNDEILRSNKILVKRIREASSAYSTAEFIKSWKELQMKAMVTRRYPQEFETQIVVSQTNKDHCMVKDLSLMKELKPSIRTKCFFEIEIRGDRQKLGIIQFELYDDVVPQTCANFAELCRGTGNGLSYKNTPFHRIVTGYWCQGGDVTKFNGSGGASVFDTSFENENYNLLHFGPGILSMCNDDENKNDSKFNLTFRRLETMDGKCVVFGKVVSGLSNIYKIEEFGTKTGKPIKTIIVSNCGIISRKHEWHPPEPSNDVENS
ncbi:probable peptidyl-prolyl cis-trans isomerase ARB_01071 [Colletes gigas]|uniref:probable peptidyl-prolyl cis-trans isomerase ARB_01071 n=1 Tax=Colletes gigas TaxID=935657 RepID=UPI001C9AA8C2|nr:probable peptidyl-prolyl cis-trans isomerase ARB_01071 [Colletes gigas]